MANSVLEAVTQAILPMPHWHRCAGHRHPGIAIGPSGERHAEFLTLFDPSHGDRDRKAVAIRLCLEGISLRQRIVQQVLGVRWRR